ncbi:hypothetical protein VT99_11316 [Candidatus Electrothrix marina]|uniref:Uncharacterized protein n=1 Tax=Candidatus Electrothrix marina TaxID=1859130 RepID=A0A444J4F2_9BACT|nr:hypothetical protein VT99_11316 [Candidatus Electrothrix marina]
MVLCSQNDFYLIQLTREWLFALAFMTLVGEIFMIEQVIATGWV